MKKTLFILPIVALSMTATFRLVAEDQSAKPRVVVSEASTMKATVQDIDHEKREVTLKGAKGETMKLKVGEEAKNFSQIKKGDHVVAKYQEAVAISMAEPGDSGTSSEQVVQRAAEGQKPAGAVTSTITTTATVEKIDRSKREVTLKGPEGNSAVVKVDPSVGDLTRIKEGDRLKISYTEALALSVDPVKE